MALLALLAVSSGSISCGAAAADRLPAFLDSTARRTGALVQRTWNIADIVEVRRITGTAISEKTRQVAFVVKQSFIDSDDIRYALYVVEPHGRRARKITEGAYLDQLASHPGSDSWTVRGDFGDGIQLYDVDVLGREHPLAVNPRTVVVGAAESVVDGNVTEGPRETGVASYEWAPDGQSLWYSIYRLRDPAERSAMAQQGITYDDREMYVHSFFNDPTRILGAELHVLRPADASDRIVAFVPGGSRVGTMFSRERGSAFWEKDSRHIQYSLWLSKPDASVEFSKWSIDVASGVAHEWPGNTPHELFNSVPAPDGRGYLTVNLTAEGRRLIQVDDDGMILKDYGLVQFNDVSSGYGFGAWSDQRRERLILAVNYNDRHGLVTIPGSRAGAALARITDSLSHCSFTRDASYGICVRESLRMAPELVEVSMEAGMVTTAIQANRAYAEINPLHVERTEWINRYGITNDGYITYPRSYVSGSSYPTVVVTHGHDARNEFANGDFQWEFPIQVLAERGYLVLSVNEPGVTSRTRAASETRVGMQANRGVSEIQFSEAYNPIASMEAALTSSIAKGLADPVKTGIAGYSRGAEIVEWAMTQSKLFHAAVEGDAGGFLAGHYGVAGEAARTYYRQLYGGSPFDPGVLENHLRLSASFRSKEFAGPLLQLFAKTNALAALEIHSSLRDAGIPTELIFFPAESHIFWDPRHRAAAMQQTADWFDYWLRGERHHDVDDQAHYARWDAMASIWKNRAPQ